MSFLDLADHQASLQRSALQALPRTLPVNLPALQTSLQLNFQPNVKGKWDHLLFSSLRVLSCICCHMIGMHDTAKRAAKLCQSSKHGCCGIEDEDLANAVWHQFLQGLRDTRIHVLTNLSRPLTGSTDNLSDLG